jgi:hypothetical protein
MRTKRGFFFVPLLSLYLLAAGCDGAVDTVPPAETPQAIDVPHAVTRIVDLSGSGCSGVSIAANATTIVWSARCEKGDAMLRVFAADKSGGNVRVVAGSITGLGDVAADDDAAYFGTWGEQPALLRATLDDAKTTSLVTGTSGEIAPYLVTLDATHVYFANVDRDVVRVPKAGGPMERVLDEAGAWGLTTQGTTLYAAVLPLCSRLEVFCKDIARGRILEVPASGDAPIALVTDAPIIGPISVNGTTVVWATESTLFATNEDGTRAIATGAANAIAFDAHGLVFAVGDSLYEAKLDGAPVQRIARFDAEVVVSVAMDAQAVYAVLNGDGSVMRVAR